MAHVYRRGLAGGSLQLFEGKLFPWWPVGTVSNVEV